MSDDPEPPSLDEESARLDAEFEEVWQQYQRAFGRSVEERRILRLPGAES